MAWPYVAEEGFEDGTLGIFNSETDTTGRLDFASYRDLARDSRTKVAPFRGAYCMRVDLKPSATEAIVTENEAFDISADGTLSLSFWLYVSPSITMANNDEFAIFRLLASSTDEGSIVINYTTANGLRIGLTTPSETSAYTPLTTGVWHHVALDIVLDDGGSNDGTLALHLDGTGSVATQATIDQGAITSAVLGVTGQDSGTTDGVLLFDDVIVDDARLYPRLDRWSVNQHLTKTGHVFVGPGYFEAQLIDGGSGDCTLKVYDTDRAEDDNHAAVEYMECDQANQTIASAYPVQVRKGCYVVLAGTNPEAIVRIRQASAWGSDGAVRQLGARVG